MTARVSHETLLAPERYELTAGSAYEFAWEHREATDLGPEMLRVPRDVLEGLHHGAKEQAIEWAGVLQRQGPQVMRQGEDDVHVGRLEHLALPGRQPRSLGRTVTFGIGR